MTSPVKGRLCGKIALVTGAAQGIGAAIATAFTQEGAVVIATDIQECPQGTPIHHLDVSQEDDWQRVLDDVSKTHGRLDILVNNAGITGFDAPFGPQDPENASLSDWQAIHRVNLDGTFLGCKYGIALMKHTGGSIINMSSRSGLVGIPGAAAYASSKAGIRNHSKTVALYCAQQGYKIRCNSIHPGAILTPLWDAMLGTGPMRTKGIEAICAGIPLGRMGHVDEVAALCLLLASDEATYITGSEFTIDGGILAGATAAPKKATADTPDSK